MSNVVAKGASRPLTGIVLLLASTFILGFMDLTTKLLVSEYPVALVGAIRYLIGTICVAAVFAPRQRAAFGYVTRKGLAIFRGALLVLSSILLGLALQRLPLAETSTLAFLAPLLVTLLSGPILGEYPSKGEWLAVIIGFTGMILMISPQSNSTIDPIGLMWAIGALFCIAGYYMTTRALSQSERPEALLLYASVIGMLILVPALPWTIQGPAPDLSVLAQFLLVGVAGTFGHFLLALAYKFTAAITLVPLSYMQLVIVVMLGWIVLDEVPGPMTGVGMILVVAASMSVAVKARR